MSPSTANRFPAILIGGPPHAGKSVLAQGLTTALTQAGIQHYLLRATPDGEGNWFHQADPAVARSLRRKGNFTPVWVERMCRDIAARPLPFIVDVGGKPEPWQEAIIDQCTHAILLTTDDDNRIKWQELAARYNLLGVANLISRQSGESQLFDTSGPVIQGVISQLERSQPVTGPIFEAILNRVKALFDYSYDELLRIHNEQAPVEVVVDLPAMYRQLNPTRASYDWQAADLPRVFEYLPGDTPLALYGRGPAWLYAAVANFIFPQPFYQFDARRGWIKPVTFRDSPTTKSPIKLNLEQTAQGLHLEVILPEDYLVYEPELRLSLPTPPPLPEPGEDESRAGVVLDGKLPNWLYTSLTLFYHSASWIAIYYPHRDEAVIVASQSPARQYSLGQTLPVTKKNRIPQE